MSKVDRAIEYMRKLVDELDEYKIEYQALINKYASAVESALDRDPDADLSIYLESFQSELEGIFEDSIKSGISTALERNNSDSSKIAAIIALFATRSVYNTSAISSKIVNTFKEEAMFHNMFLKEKVSFKDFVKDPRRIANQNGINIDTLKNEIASVKGGISYRVSSNIDSAIAYIAVKAHQDTLVEEWKEEGVKGYIGHRASTYDCPECDEVCERFFPLDKMVFPVHPHCCCVIVEVTLPQA